LEIAIKTRSGKLILKPETSALPAIFRGLGIALLVIDERHVVASVEPEPATRDPFDRLVLAQCWAEDLRLVTVDRALIVHPLALR
jgi:PIN domain nuclease of toxin-antitoxin system